MKPALLAAVLACAMTTAAHADTALFAGGCFWSMEKAFQETPGVSEAVSGFAGGTVKNPSYDAVVRGGTGHRETVRVEYDPAKISYAQLLDVYWHHIDPTDARGQFCDKGTQYHAAIFYTDATQKAAAETSKEALVKRGRFKTVVTEILPAAPFYPADAYHQDFYKTHAAHYNRYRIGCGRDARMKALWGDEAPVP